MEHADNTEFIARYRLDEAFMLSITKDSTVCYVDDSFLITVTNKQIYINGKPMVLTGRIPSSMRASFPTSPVS